MDDTALPAWKPDVVIHHDHCADGFAAAWACWTRWREGCTYIPASYGQPAPDVDGLNVLLVDFSYKRAEIDAMANSAASVVILDHHKTAEADLEAFRFHESGPGAISPADIHGILRDLDELHRPPVIAIFDMDRSGARMAWDFCRGADPSNTPVLIYLIEDRDLWRFRHEDTKPFSLWLRSEAFSFQRFAVIAKELESDRERDGIMAEARAMQRFSDAKVDEIAAFARREALAGHEPMVVSCPPMFASEVGHALLDKHPGIPFAAMYYDAPKVRMWSLRSRDDREDVSAIASAFGGGGHRNAAGFSVPAINAAPAGLPKVCVNPTPCGLLEAISGCHVRSSAFRVADPNTRYPKNHPTPLLERIPVEDQVATDWLEHDPREGSEQAWLAFLSKHEGARHGQ